MIAEPYYTDNMVTLFNGDCVEGMSGLAEGLYDLLLTSPPYCVGKEYEEGMEYGDYLKLLWGFYKEGFRIIKKGGYCISIFAPYYMSYGANARYQPIEYLHHIIAERAGWVHQTTRIWQKDFATLDDKYSIASNLPKLEYEFILSLRKPGGGREKVREQKYHPRALWDTTGFKQKVPALKRHPAAFPEILVRMILEVYSDEGDTVIDPFSGSGTTLWVAKKMARRSIGWELDTGYCESARWLLSQQTLLQLPPEEKAIPEQATMSVGETNV